MKEREERVKGEEMENCIITIYLLFLVCHWEKRWKPSHNHTSLLFPKLVLTFGSPMVLLFVSFVPTVSSQLKLKLQQEEDFLLSIRVPYLLPSWHSTCNRTQSKKPMTKTKKAPNELVCARSCHPVVKRNELCLRCLEDLEPLAFFGRLGEQQRMCTSCHCCCCRC